MIFHNRGIITVFVVAVATTGGIVEDTAAVNTVISTRIIIINTINTASITTAIVVFAQGLNRDFYVGTVGTIVV